MEQLKDHHHFKVELIDPSDKVAKCERYVVDLLLNSSLPDSQRESSIAFELKHHTSTAQIARILARKRGLPVDVCAVGAILHDIYVIIHGKYKDHAHLGASIAKEILERIGGFTEEEMAQVWRIIYHHSEKHVWSNDPFEEFGKDADILDSFLYPGAFGFYLKHKPLGIFYEYIVRARKIWRELSIPDEPRFDILNNYNSHWFDLSKLLDRSLTIDFLSNLIYYSSLAKTLRFYPPTYCVLSCSNQFKFLTNSTNWLGFIQILENTNIQALAGLLDVNYWADSRDRIGTIFDNEISTSNRPARIENIEYKTQAENLLDMTNNNNVILVVWPAIDSYELPQGSELQERIHDLGIT